MDFYIFKTRPFNSRYDLMLSSLIRWAILDWWYASQSLVDFASCLLRSISLSIVFLSSGFWWWDNLTPWTIWHLGQFDTDHARRTIWHLGQFDTIITKKINSQISFLLESFEVKNNQDDILGQNYPKSLIQLISGTNRAPRPKPNLNPLQLFGLQIWLEVKY